MTSRLVALMSLVLLLTLAAFALVIGHYQRGVMAELQRTVSVVSRETLRSLESRPLTPAAGQAGRAAGPGAGPSRVVVIAGTRPGGPAGDGKSPIWVPHQDGGEERQEIEVIEKRASSAEERFLFVRVDAVRAEQAPGRGLVLRIPTLSEEALPGGAETPRQPTRSPVLAGEPEGPAQARAGLVLHREIELPVPTRDFEALFAAARRRSALVFLAALLVGTALAATVAMRFTRPIRRLDAAIHRLSEGDLDVQVEAPGRDEVGRLGRAFNDMARRLRAGRERARELTRKEKLQALGRLAAGVAHDVRNPLHSIGLTLQHLEETSRPPEPERRAEFDRSLGLIRSEIKRLDALVSNFLRFARGGRTQREPVDLAGLAREVSALLEKEAERRGVTVKVSASASLPAVPADAEAVRSAVLNLVLNALEATASGGEVSLILAAQEGAVLLEVADDGRGIPAEDQEKVFDFAYTTREDGHGLGLAMVHQVVVEEHGGQVRLDSREGAGTRVTLALPTTAAKGSPA